MVKPPLFDSNILVDYLSGVIAAKDELDKYRQMIISKITWIEVMVGVSPLTRLRADTLFGMFTIVPVDDDVAALAVTLRQTTRKKLPDCLIHATALLHASEIVSRNHADFPAIIGSSVVVRVPYVIQAPLPQ
jgi:predicted nucleic acid-binding protein